MISEEITTEVPQLDMPADLLAEVSRRNAERQADFHVDGWKPSLLERFARMLGFG
jgi:hypothetical protein